MDKDKNDNFMFRKFAYLGLCIGIKQALSGQRHCLNKSFSQPKMKNLVSCLLEVFGLDISNH